MQTGLADILTISPVIPVLVIDHVDDAVPLAKALSQGGLKVLEVTLRTDAALSAIAAMRQACPELIIGAGTILTDEHYRLAVEAGSQFIVSPGVCDALLLAAKCYAVPFLPGTSTLSEMITLYNAGYRRLKFFPAELNGGAAFLKTVSAVMPELSFCPTGGISSTNAKAYLDLPNVVCVGGSWMATAEIIKAKRWDDICQQSRLAAAFK